MATIQQVLQTLLLLFSIQLAFLICSGLGSNFMIGGDVLTAGGQNLTYMEYSLTLQSDCNLVLKNGSTRVWETMTGGYSAECYVTLDLNGKLAVWHPRFRYPLWSSGIMSQVGYYALVLRYDGTLRIVGWTWTKTTESVLYSGDVAPIGTTIVNGNNELTLLDDCNLVLNGDGATKWQTGVTDRTMHDCYVNLEANGELRVKHWGGDVLWTNRVASPTYLGVCSRAAKPTPCSLSMAPVIWSNVISGAVSGKIDTVSAD
ncbi:mannose-specific lectin-like [Dioscorea cayenensis subsp. rotundata]|uniref:Mannose-specific lectin-like n=1 Tax=Dioscorea cayennensis subsp. rotundata TaxID=55577 RepID=A0AB40D3S9_DIOCR|nr:mannose-specific lectin-like [Dioscorea cayenensis subsp. rotundata]